MTRYSRAEWSADAPNGRYLLDPLKVEGLALHWPATTTRYQTVKGVIAALRAWQRFHMQSRGWSDIAYQEAVDQAGNSYVLRGFRYRPGANGDLDVNQRFGALLLILAEGEEPSPAMIATVRRRVARHRALFPHSRTVVGHGQIRPGGTQCPGPSVQRLIGAGAFEPRKAHQ